MVRTYQRKFTNSRNGKNFSPYTSYSTEDLEKAIELIHNGSLKLKEAAEKYNIPKSTLSRKSRNINCTQAKAGHPTLFSNDEEMVFLEYIKLLSVWGFPMDSTDLRVFVQKYLNKIGKTLYGLKDNMPGVDWARNFINRHKSEISNRQATNISSERAKISLTVIDDFFSHYKETVEGVSPDCLINYDETNLTDDPGNKKYLFKRGCKYPERVINNTKTSISLMFTGTGDGQLLPIYVVYKAEHLWDQWLEGGPTGTRYNRSRSGWFDSTCFEDWFITIIVPYVKTKHGQKVVLIGDNLSSHFSQSVLKTCQELNIIFVCLPPKTTHLLQPLDVAFYAPLKKYWRDVLTQWKKTDGAKHKTLVKSSFPNLLLKLQNKLTEKGSDSSNIIAGFNKCGLYPICPERPKSRLPKTNSVPEEKIQNTASAVVMEILQDMRNPTEIREQPKRKKKIYVPPGKSITVEDLRVEQTQTIESQENERKNNNKCRQKKNKRKRSKIVSYKRDRSSSTDFDMTKDIGRENDFDHSIAGPSGLCKTNKHTPPNQENLERGNESDATYVSSNDEFRDNKSELTTLKIKEKTHQPASSFFISIKGKGKGKKSKLQAPNTNNKNIEVSEINKKLHASSTVKKSSTVKRRKPIRKCSISSTSVSDIMSMHSDSDLFDDDIGKHSSDLHDDNSNQYIKMKILPYKTKIKDNSDEEENEKSEEDNNSLPLFFFHDKSGVEEVVVGDDNNAVTLISFDENVLYNKTNIETDDKKSYEVMGNIDQEDMIENKENNIDIGKRVTIVKEERIENILPQKKVGLKNLKPISLDQPIITSKKKNNYYINSQEILKALLDND